MSSVTIMLSVSAALFWLSWSFHHCILSKSDQDWQQLGFVNQEKLWQTLAILSRHNDVYLGMYDYTIRRNKNRERMCPSH